MLSIAKTPAEMVAELVARAGSVNVPRFASLTYRNEHGELANHQLLIGMNLAKAYERDYALVSLYCLRPGLSNIYYEAACEIRQSLADSLLKGIGYNPRYVHGPDKADTFVNILPGISVNKSDNAEDRGTVYLLSYCVRKTILETGTYPVVKHRDKTKAKNAIKAELHLRTDRVRRYKLREVKRGALDGRTIILSTE